MLKAILKNKLRLLTTFWLSSFVWVGLPCLLFPSLLFGVEQIDHFKKPYTSSKGHIYYPDRKIQLFSASGQSKSGLQTLKTQSKKDYLLLKNIGANVVSPLIKTDSGFAAGKALSKDASFVIYYDPIPPVVNLGYKKGYLKDNIHYYKKFDSLTINAIDKLSGIEQVYVSINGSAYRPYHDKKLNFPGDGFYEVLIYAADNVGNASIPRLLKININSQAPKTDILIAPYPLASDAGKLILSKEHHIVLKARADDPGVKNTYYSFNQGKVVNRYKKSLSLKKLRSGENTINFYSVDKLGNKEPDKSVNFYLDSQPPKLNAKILGEVITKSGKTYLGPSSKIELQGSDNKAGVLDIIYNFNNQKSSLYRKPLVLPTNRVYHTLKVWAIDQVENRSQPLKLKYVLDQTPPKVKVEYIGHYVLKAENTLYITPKTKIKLSAVDDLSGIAAIYYTINSGSNREYSERYRTPITIAEGENHHLSYFSQDKVGNISNTKELKIIVDDDAPEIQTSFDKPPFGKATTINIAKSYPPRTRLFLSALDNASGVKSIVYRLNEQAEQPYFDSIVLSKSGINNISIKVKDQVDNTLESVIEVSILD